MSKKIVVVGGLAAGPSAASKAKRTSPDADVLLFEQGADISYGICEIPYYIAGEVNSSLIVNTPQQLREKKGVEVRTLHSVNEIRPIQRKISVRNLQTGKVTEEPFDKLILATGSRPLKMNVEGEDARNVFTVKSLEDGRSIFSYIESEKPKHATVIGGGYIGIEMAEALRRRSIEVTMHHIYSLPLNGLERETRERVRETLQRNNVTFMGHSKTEGLVCNKSQRVTHVVTNQGSFETDLVIIAVGVTPNSELAAKAGIRVGASGGILTDQRQQTNLDNIFAAGDCCEVKNIVNNKSMYIPLATIASKQAWVAGTNAAGGTAAFPGAIRSAAVRVFGMEVARAGLSSEEAAESGFDVVTETVRAYSKVAMMPGSKKLSLTLIADKQSRRILGVNGFGEEGVVLRTNTLAVGIQQKVSVDDMQHWDLAYSPPFTPLWDPVLVAVNALRKQMSWK